MLPHRFERAARGSRSSKAMDRLSGLLDVSPDTEPEDDLTLLPGGQLEWHVDCATGIETGPHFARQAHPGHRSRIAKRAVAPNKLTPVATDSPSCLVHVKEGHPSGELRVIGITREDHAALVVQFRHNMHCRFWPQISQHPFHVTRRGQLARSA